MSQGQPPQPSEEERKRWELHRDAASAEKDWMNARLGWLFIPQGILFAAFSFTLRVSDRKADADLVNAVRLWLPLLGIFISVVVLVAVAAAACMHQKWTRVLIDIARGYPDGEFTFGSPPAWPAWVARWFPVLIPVFFIVAWVCLLCSC